MSSTGCRMRENSFQLETPSRPMTCILYQFEFLWAAIRPTLCTFTNEMQKSYRKLFVRHKIYIHNPSQSLLDTVLSVGNRNGKA